MLLVLIYKIPSKVYISLKLVIIRNKKDFLFKKYIYIQKTVLDIIATLKFFNRR